MTNQRNRYADGWAALTDRQRFVLCQLYEHKRENPSNPYLYLHPKFFSSLDLLERRGFATIFRGARSGSPRGAAASKGRVTPEGAYVLFWARAFDSEAYAEAMNGAKLT